MELLSATTKAITGILGNYRRDISYTRIKKYWQKPFTATTFLQSVKEDCVVASLFSSFNISLLTAIAAFAISSAATAQTKNVEVLAFQGGRTQDDLAVLVLRVPHS